MIGIITANDAWFAAWTLIAVVGAVLALGIVLALVSDDVLPRHEDRCTIRPAHLAIERPEHEPVIAYYLDGESVRIIDCTSDVAPFDWSAYPDL